jgi:acetolactate synthase small subunit
MCIVLRGQDGVIEQARRQLEDLVRRRPAFLISRSLQT